MLTPVVCPRSSPCSRNRQEVARPTASLSHDMAEDASGDLEDISGSNEISDRRSNSPTRAGHELRASIAGLEFAIRREGWLYKNHHGGPFAKTHKRRWFLSDGFHVEYFEDEARTRRTGRFDLRNVVGLGASTEVTRGLDFQLSESKSGQPSSQPRPCPYRCPISTPTPSPTPHPSPTPAQASRPRRSPSPSKASRRLRAARGARCGSLLSRRRTWARRCATCAASGSRTTSTRPAGARGRAYRRCARRCS